MEGFDQFLLPYIISQLVAVTMLYFTWRNTKIGRILFSILFLYAGIYNMYIGFWTPEEYIGFSQFAVPFYKRFIEGWFSEYNYVLIPVIAACQLLIAVGMTLRSGWVTTACIGAIAFFAGITPLMYGSAFPFTLIAGAAVYLIIIKDDKSALFRKRHIYNR